jgi:hypothetical protein
MIGDTLFFYYKTLYPVLSSDIINQNDLRIFRNSILKDQICFWFGIQEEEMYYLFFADNVSNPLKRNSTLSEWIQNAEVWLTKQTQTS